MERTLIELLKELDKHYPNYVTVSTVTTKNSEARVISDGIEDGVIAIMNKRDRNAYGDLDFGALVRLTANGYALLNQINTRKALEDFSKSSDSLSKSLNKYTIILLLVTLVVGISSFAVIDINYSNIAYPTNFILIWSSTILLSAALILLVLKFLGIWT